MIWTVAAAFFLGTIVGSLFRDLIDLIKDARKFEKSNNRRPWEK